MVCTSDHLHLPLFGHGVVVGGRRVSGVPGLECEDGGRLKTREVREAVCQQAGQAICVLEVPKGSPK